MSLSKVLCSTCVSLLLAIGHPVDAVAQSYYPATEGEMVKLQSEITFPRGEMSGICAIRLDGGLLKGCIFNEFGISALDFTYNPDSRKVRILHAIPMLNRWMVKRLLRKDLAIIMQRLQSGELSYTNEKRHIQYTFHPLADDAEQ